MWTKYTNNNEIGIEFSSKRKHEHSTSRIFDKLFTWAYKKARQSRQAVVKIQSVLCEMAIYRAAQWLLINGASFILVSVFSDSQAAIRSLSGLVNNSRILGECRRCLDLLSGPFSVSLVWIFGHSSVLWNCTADELARAGALVRESSSIKLGMPLGSFKLAILSERQSLLGQWGVLLCR